jgi:hypothetical protein
MSGWSTRVTDAQGNPVDSPLNSDDRSAESAPEQPLRILTADGNQIVQVWIGTTGGIAYTYEWPGAEPLKVGDKVIVPGNWFRPDPSFAEVVGLGSDYEGPLAVLLGRAE